MLTVTLKWAQTICVSVHTFFKPAPQERRPSLGLLEERVSAVKFSDFL